MINTNARDAVSVIKNSIWVGASVDSFLGPILFEIENNRWNTYEGQRDEHDKVLRYCHDREWVFLFILVIRSIMIAIPVLKKKNNKKSANIFSLNSELSFPKKLIIMFSINR